jgi:Protein of unknown function (DUF4239)
VSALFDTTVVVGGCLAFSGAGLFIVRKFFHKVQFEKHHEVAGYLLTVVGTMYSVLLGLIVVNVQGKFDQAKQMAETEANSCSDLWNYCRGLPGEVRYTIRMPLKDYYVSVQNEDWEAIAAGETVEQSVPQYQGMWRAIAAYQPQTNRESACYSNILETMKSLADARRFRMVARRRLLSPIIWMVLIAGCVLTILFSYFFWVDSARTQIALTFFVTIFIALNMLLVRLFENPYRSEFFVKEGAFTLKPDLLNPTEEDLARYKANPVSIKAPPSTADFEKSGFDPVQK